MGLIASVFNMRGTTHSNELIWYFDTGLDSSTGKFFVITCNRIRLGGLDGILVFDLRFGFVGARNSNCHGQSNTFESDFYHYKLKHVTAN